MTIHVRPATLHDAVPTAHIGAIAFSTIPLMVACYPCLPSNTSHWATLRVSKMSRAVYAPRIRLLVACDDETQTVVGYALYRRVGTSALARAIAAEKQSWLTLVQRTLDAAGDAVFRLLAETRDAKTRRMMEERVYGELERRSWGDDGERWMLESLAVDAAWRGCGAGGKLLREGMRWAEEEGVVLVLEATEDGRRLYEKVGFRVVRPAESIESVEMGCTMDWMPSSMAREKS